MAHQIRIETDKCVLTAKLNDSITANAIWESLPIESKAFNWGGEIWFYIDVKLPEYPDARREMGVGELGYWPRGPGFCIFYGRTPESIDDQPRGEEPGNPFGWVEGDSTVLNAVKDGDNIRVEGIT